MNSTYPNRILNQIPAFLAILAIAGCQSVPPLSRIPSEVPSTVADLPAAPPGDDVSEESLDAVSYEPLFANRRQPFSERRLSPDLLAIAAESMEALREMDTIELPTYGAQLLAGLERRPAQKLHKENLVQVCGIAILVGLSFDDEELVCLAANRLASTIRTDLGDAAYPLERDLLNLARAHGCPAIGSVPPGALGVALDSDRRDRLNLRLIDLRTPRSDELNGHVNQRLAEFLGAYYRGERDLSAHLSRLREEIKRAEFVGATISLSRPEAVGNARSARQLAFWWIYELLYTLNGDRNAVTRL